MPTTKDGIVMGQINEASSENSFITSDISNELTPRTN